jgi:YVTN family beta-propeller protein
VIDARRHRLLDTIPLPRGSAPVGVAVSPDGRLVYVANGRADSVSVIDVRARAVAASIPVGRRPWGVALTRDGRRLYVANGRSNSVSIIDTATKRVVAAVPVGAGPWGIAIAD